MRAWTLLGFSSLYYLLGKLEVAGLVERLELPGKRTRKVFSITKQGLTLCRQSVAHMLVEIRPYNSSLLVGLANSPLLDRATLLKCLQSREQHIQDRLTTVVTTQNQQQPLPDFVE